MRVERNGNSVSFEQAAHSFVRDLNRTVTGTTMAVAKQRVGGATWTVVLRR